MAVVRSHHDRHSDHRPTDVVLFVMALVPIMFRQPFERMNPRFFGGAILVLMGAIIVLLS